MNAPAIDPDEIKRLYVRDRVQVSHIAQRLGLPKQDVYYALRTQGVRLRRDRRDHRRRGRLVELYGQGRSVAQAAQEIGCCATTAARDLRAAGVKLRTAEQRRRVASERWQAGASLAEIADELGAISETVVGWLTRSGVTRSELDARKRRDSERAMLAGLQRFAERSSERLSAAAYDRYRASHEPGLPSAHAINERFGDWRRALAAADVDIEDARRRVIAEAMRKLKQPVSMADYQRLAAANADIPSYSTLVGIFGGWQEACEAAGVRATASVRQRLDGSVWPRAERALRALADTLGRTPVLADYHLARDQDPSLPSMASLYRHYGSWIAALDAAEARRSRPDRRTRRVNARPATPQIIEFVKELAAEGPVTAAAYSTARAGRNDVPSMSTLYSRYGGLAAVLEAAGIPDAAGPKAQRVTDQQIVADLRAAAERADGQPLTCTRYDRIRSEQLPDLLSSPVIRKWMGPWRDALAAAGVA